MRLSTFVSALSWASVFALSWAMILQKTPANGLTLGLFGFFTLVGTLAGIWSMQPPRSR